MATIILKKTSLATLMLATLSLSGCVTTKEFQEANQLLKKGESDKALEKFYQAKVKEPSNAKYAIQYLNLRDKLVNNLIVKAEIARKSGSLSEAEKLYREIQKYDPTNPMAKLGQELIQRDRLHLDLVSQNKKDVEKLQPINEKIKIENPNSSLLETKSDSAVADNTAYREMQGSFKKVVSLEFKDAPLKSVIDVLSQVSELNFFYDKDIRPDIKITAKIDNLSIEDALKLILNTNGLSYKILSPKALLIYPNNEQKANEYENLEVRSFYLENAKASTVAENLKSLLKLKNIVIDERLNMLIVRDNKQTMDVVDKLIGLQDMTDPEVVLDVAVLEVKRSRLLELGLKPPLQASLAVMPKANSTLTLNDLMNITPFNTQVSVDQVVANIKKDNQDSNILANPQIRVKNREKALIQIGDRVPVITTTSTSTGFVSESVSYVDVGLKLEVEPNIRLNNEVSIKTSLEVSNLIREVRSSNGALAYQIGTRNANTVLQLANGETQILAGLINDEQRKSATGIPVLVDLPVLGRLFGSNKDDKQRTEIVLAITPHIVRNVKRPDENQARFESGTTNSVSSNPYIFVPSTGNKGAISNASPTPSRDFSTPSNNISSNLPLSPAPQPVVDNQVRLQWQLPSQIKVGEQFSIMLNADTQKAMEGIPLLFNYDKDKLKPIAVEEGDFFKQGGANTSYSAQVDEPNGRITAVVLRDNNKDDGTINGKGSLVKLTFQALKPGNSNVQLTSASPEPSAAIVANLPLDANLQID